MAPSQTDDGIQAILANPVLINAYKEGMACSGRLGKTLPLRRTCATSASLAVKGKDYIFTGDPARVGLTRSVTQQMTHHFKVTVNHCHDGVSCSVLASETGSLGMRR